MAKNITSYQKLRAAQRVQSRLILLGYNAPWVCVEDRISTSNNPSLFISAVVLENTGSECLAIAYVHGKDKTLADLEAEFWIQYLDSEHAKKKESP